MVYEPVLLASAPWHEAHSHLLICVGFSLEVWCAVMDRDTYFDRQRHII